MRTKLQVNQPVTLLVIIILLVSFTFLLLIIILLISILTRKDTTTNNFVYNNSQPVNNTNNNNTNNNNATTDVNSTYMYDSNNVKYETSSPESGDNSPNNFYPSLSPSLPDTSNVPTASPPLPSSSSSSPSLSPQIQQQQQLMQPTTNNTIMEIENSFMGLKKRGGGSGIGGQIGGDEGWVKIADTIYHHGRVGINTAIPMEALTVNGSIFLFFLFIFSHFFHFFSFFSPYFKSF